MSEISTFIKTKTNSSPYATIYFLGSLKDPKRLPILLDIINTREGYGSKLAAAQVASLRGTAVNALGNLGSKGASKTLLEILVNTNENFAIRKDAAEALGKIGEEKAAMPLMEILKNSVEDKYLKIGAFHALEALNEKRGVDIAIEILKDTTVDLMLRISAASYLGKIGDRTAIKPLKDMLKDPSAHSYLIHAVEIALRKFDKK